MCIIDVKTHAHHVLTRPSKNPDGTLDEGSVSLIHVSWSPNGQDIAFDGRHDVTCPVIPGIPPDPTIQCTQSDIYRANVHTGAVTELTDSNDLMAQYSPDGHELVFTHIHFFGTNTSPTGIYIASASGAHPRLLVSADHMLHGGYPAWSPDGKQIVYSSGSDGANDGNTDLFTVNAVGHLCADARDRHARRQQRGLLDGRDHDLHGAPADGQDPVGGQGTDQACGLQSRQGHGTQVQARDRPEPGAETRCPDRHARQRPPRLTPKRRRPA